MSKLKKLLFVCIALTIAGAFGFAGFFIYGIYWTTEVIMPNAYATDWTAHLIIEHLKVNDNRWPKSWADLRDDYDRVHKPDYYPWSWEELQSRISIDWQADPVTLAAANGSADPPFRVIRLTDGTSYFFVNGEPNRQIYDYLQTTDLADRDKSR